MGSHATRFGVHTLALLAVVMLWCSGCQGVAPTGDNPQSQMLPQDVSEADMNASDQEASDDQGQMNEETQDEPTVSRSDLREDRRGQTSDTEATDSDSETPNDRPRSRNGVGGGSEPTDPPTADDGQTETSGGRRGTRQGR